MFGKNPKRPPETGDGSTLSVVEIFPTLQGEGPYVGQPAVFVRLGGCNLACDFCDTEFEQFEAMGLEALVQSIVREAGAVSPLPLRERVRVRGLSSVALHPNAPSSQPSPARGEGATAPSTTFLRDLVVITGGEPLRQNIVPLCERLLAEGLRVQVETNGTLWRPLPAGVDIVCSPKVTDGSYHALRPDLLERVSALKFIVSAAPGPYHAVGDVGQVGRAIPVYVQPMDEYDPAKNEANRKHALELAMGKGYRLSLQTHKMLGIA